MRPIPREQQSPYGPGHNSRHFNDQPAAPTSPRVQANLAGQPPPAGQTLITVKQALARLSIGRNSAYNLINSNEIESIRLHGRRLIVSESIDRLIARHLAHQNGGAGG